MIQDIAPKVYDNQFGSRRAPSPEDLLIVARKNLLLLNSLKADDNEIEFPRVGELEGGDTEIVEVAAGRYQVGDYILIYLFSIDQEAYYGIDEEGFDEKVNQGDVLSGYSFRTPMAILRSGGPKHLAFAGVTATQLYRWRMDHRFCGCCGTKMKPSATERAYVCPECKATVYPKICPAVIVAVTHNGRILVSRYNGRPNVKTYALIAGFAEVGETIEETVHREVLEEVGVKVKNLRFYKSQPWSFSDTLLMGFYCELDGDDTITLDQEELSMAAWLTPEELPERSNEISLTAEMMEEFRLGHQPQ